MNLNVGDVVTNTLNVLGCRPGRRGVVYDIYDDFDIPEKNGVSIIFENGKYDGFSYEEQHLMLKQEPAARIPYKIKDYKFENVMKLSQDYKNGFWDEIFR